MASDHPVVAKPVEMMIGRDSTMHKSDSLDVRTKASLR
jgi:hypothetical protein